MGKRIKRGSKEITRHHIRPKSRNGDNSYTNIAEVTDRDHKYYHALFYDKTPDEIIIWLVNRFWNGQWHWVEKARKGGNHD